MSNSLLAIDYAGYHQIRSNPLADLVVSAIVLARNSNRRPGVKVGRFPLGVPMFTFNGEPFYGQDRLKQLRWRIDHS